MHFAHKISLPAAAIVALGFNGAGAQAGTVCSTHQPIEAMSTDLGSKSALTYFISKEGACSVVLMISEKFDPEGDAPASSASRIRLALTPGENVSMDSEEGGSLAIQCGQDAGLMHVATGSREDIAALLQKADVSLCAPDPADSARLPVRISGFGPGVSDDSSLNANIGVLAQKIAWYRSPESDVFQLAIATPDERPFTKAALESEPMRGAGFSPQVHDDASLNANEDALTQWIAYRNAPKSDAFRPAEPEMAVASAVFLRVSLASIPRGSMGYSGQ